PKVINGCSDLFVEVFGEAGRHARSAVGNAMLPNQISVEIEGIVAVKGERPRLLRLIHRTAVAAIPECEENEMDIIPLGRGRERQEEIRFTSVTMRSRCALSTSIKTHCGPKLGEWLCWDGKRLAWCATTSRILPSGYLRFSDYGNVRVPIAGSILNNHDNVDKRRVGNPWPYSSVRARNRHRPVCAAGSRSRA